MPYITSHMPVFDQCFDAGLSAREAYKKLQSAPSNGMPDFTIYAPLSKKSALGWLGWAMMIPLYPAQSSVAKQLIGKFHPAHLDKIREMDRKEIESQGTHYTREVKIEKNGVSYCGLMMGRKEFLTNGKWILQAMGRNCPIERAARKCRSIYSEAGFNVLMINGPSIGRSQGAATPHSLGEAQEAGICFLETAVKAKQIALAGHSIGGGVIGQAALQHAFRKDVDYLVIRQSTFDRIGNAVKSYVPFFKEAAKASIHSNSLEMDNVEASKRLEKLGIKEVIIQTSNRDVKRGGVPQIEDFESDGVIVADASLGYALVKEGVLGHKIFRCLPHLSHFDSKGYMQATIEELEAHFKPQPHPLRRWLTSFFLIP